MNIHISLISEDLISNPDSSVRLCKHSINISEHVRTMFHIYVITQIIKCISSFGALA